VKTSYDEVRRMAFRALDGARSPAGIDEDSAHGTAWLEAIDLPGMTLLADAIDTSEPDRRARGLSSGQTGERAWRIDADGLSCAFCAATVIDLLIATAETGPDACSTIELTDAKQPLFLIPMAARFCPDGGSIQITWRQDGKDQAFTVTLSGVWLNETSTGDSDGPDASSTGSVTLTSRAVSGLDQMLGRRIDQGLASTLRQGLDVDDNAYARIAAYAAKILVPETATSRVSGAGAGLTDND